MSAAEKLERLLTPEEYLESELLSEVKREYVGGELYAMAGATVAHNQIVSNLVAGLAPQLKGTPCRVFSNDLKVRVKGADDYAFYYPDVMIVCGRLDPKDVFCEEPAVIFEVLSPGTERRDRTQKHFAYVSIPSLQAYVLIHQSERAVTVFRRVEGVFRQELLQGAGATLHLPFVKCRLSLDEIYEGVKS